MLREEPIFSAVFQYSRLILTGIVPFTTLLYLYLRIYLILRRRRKSRLEESTAEEKEEFQMHQITPSTDDQIDLDQASWRTRRKAVH